MSKGTAPKVFISKIEELKPAKELRLRWTPSFGHFHDFFPKEAVEHPAKANTDLVAYLIERYTKEGEVVLDPMSGTGSTAVIAALSGRNAVAIELEDKFVKLIEHAKARVDAALTLNPKGNIRIIKGDARQLTSLLNGADVAKAPHSQDWNAGVGDGGQRTILDFCYDAVVTPPPQADAVTTSPPYSDSPVHNYAETDEAFREFKKQIKEQLRTKGYIEYDGKKYTEAEWRALNSGELRPRGIPELWEKIINNVSNQHYNDDNPDNIGNFPHGEVDVVITSPPYGEAQQGGGIAKNGYHDPERASPDMIGKRTPMPDQFADPNNIFNMKKETYVEAMFRVYQEVYQVLKPGGLAAVIIKPIIRDRKPIDLPWQTWLLLQSIGFDLYDVLKLRLNQTSFWRIVLERHHPDVERLKHEYVIVVRK